MTVRKFRQQDKEALVSLWRAVFPDDPPHNEPSRMIEEKLKVDDLIFVAEEDGNIVGGCMAGYDGHRGWLYAVAVLPACRGRGTGSHLVEFAMEHLKQLGCIKVNLQLRAGNRAAAFYRAIGFSVEDRISMGKPIGGGDIR